MAEFSVSGEGCLKLAHRSVIKHAQPYTNPIASLCCCWVQPQREANGFVYSTAIKNVQMLTVLSEIKRTQN